MRNVTITMEESLLERVKIEAARRDKSVSRFVSDLIEEWHREDDERSNILQQFLTKPGYSGLMESWKGRDALYAEREDELLRRYQSSRLRDRRPGGDEDAADPASSSDHHFGS